jgi:hypothetical protein
MNNQRPQYSGLFLLVKNQRLTITDTHAIKIGTSVNEIIAKVIYSYFMVKSKI